MELAFLIGRILYGGFFVVMGMNHFTKFAPMVAYASSKRVPFPRVSVPVTGLMIVLGGLGIASGATAYLRVSVFLISVFLLLVSLFMHNFWAIADPQEKTLQMVHFLKNAALLGAGLMLLSIPSPWSYSIF
ncbi:MAG: hypothetical protein A2847_01805 [Candidatus Sungbacteria bacterium RIFCSPHIGHO2_01_FULL_50_25]|uniref:DoxX family protein n=1 Tax=Candidatus Sungbacteria bacterium RIFCSPHIGHO2_01_FULL_50_25 TaxID=1802265 RepID=A0A1G2KAT6_9BACT|nr:MAG: hypothetical protein A2847_01805 [Candidatus Sungbacteria bacterium RIFCSPHIGHO2_01_FULL_50_25]